MVPEDEIRLRTMRGKCPRSASTSKQPRNTLQREPSMSGKASSLDMRESIGYQNELCKAHGIPRQAFENFCDARRDKFVPGTSSKSG
jgi:hypothetical protein